MSMKIKILCFLFAVSTFSVKASIKGLVNNFSGFDGLSFLKFGTCDYSKCAPMPKHYEELGCHPVLSAGECCPESFNCEGLVGRKGKKCYYQGKMWQENSKISDESLQRSCITEVYCSQQGKFNYTQKICAESFGPPLQPGCLRMYDRDKCCSVGTVCGDDAKQLSTCRFEGKTYREGERMFSTVHKCYQCLCAADFDDAKSVLTNENCFKVNCGIELREKENINNKCIPVYHSDVCCPLNWRCPHRNDAIIPHNGERNTKANQKCKFGNLEFELGDSLSTRENYCSNCTCLTPPMLSCTYSYYC